MASNNNAFEKRLWDAADELRANSRLSSQDFSIPVLGLIFLKFADHRFAAAEKEIMKGSKSRRRSPGPTDYHARGVLFLPETARFANLIELKDRDDVGKAINDAMKAVEGANSDLKGVLPRGYAKFQNRSLLELLKLMNSIPMDVEGDVFGRIYEYFLGHFAMSEGRKGGEFFTPTSIVKLIVEVIEPFHGRIFDPACGSGGMFVQSARFVENHKKNPSSEISVFGQERATTTVQLCKMNLAVHGLSGDIREANSYYEDLHDEVGTFDFVMANPPFNVNRVDKERIKDDRARFPFGMPSVDNANYIWIQLFHSSLNEKGRAGFVMANSAGDARGSELEIRKKLIEKRAVDVIVSIGSNFFYTVTLPCTLWFLDKGKEGTDREDRVLFIDAREIYNQIDRAHRDFLPEQIEFLANIVRLYRGEKIEDERGGGGLLAERMPPAAAKKPRYEDVPGLCKAATIDEIEEQGWSLNPGRYVGVADKVVHDGDFKEELSGLLSQFETLTEESHAIENGIRESISRILG